MTLAVNGKTLAQAMTGTQRYAYELLRRLARDRPGEIVLHVPRDAVVPDELAASVVVRRSRSRGQLFEQVALPWAARRDLLLSLGGPAPLLGRRQVVTLHDVSVFRFPETYSAVFGALVPAALPGVGPAGRARAHGLGVQQGSSSRRCSAWTRHG